MDGDSRRGRALDGRTLDCSIGERRTADGKLEVLGIESADPRWVVQSADALADTAHRLRAIGAIAVSLCQVAAGGSTRWLRSSAAAPWTPPPRS